MMCNTYRFEELEVGHTEAFQVIMTKEKMDMFAEMTGDRNPLHMQKEFSQKIFGGGYQHSQNCVAYGMLTASFYSTLAGMYLPGKWSLIHSVDVKFLQPVYPQDQLTVVGRVREKHENFRLLVIQAQIRNQDGKKVSKAVMKVGVTHE